MATNYPTFPSKDRRFWILLMTDEQTREELIRNSGEWATTPLTPPVANSRPPAPASKLSLADLKQRAKKNNSAPPMTPVPPVAPPQFPPPLNSEAGFSELPSTPFFNEPLEEAPSLPFEPTPFVPQPLEAAPAVQPTTNPLLAKILGQTPPPSSPPTKPSIVAPVVTPTFEPPNAPTFRIEESPFSTPLPAPVRSPDVPTVREDFSLPVIPAWDLPETVWPPVLKPVKKEEPVVENTPARPEDSEDLEELERQQQAAAQKARDLSTRKAELEARKIREAAETEKERILAEAEKQKHARLAEAEERFNAVVAVEKTADEARRSKDQAAAQEREELRAKSEAELAAREAELSSVAAAREAELSAAAADLEVKRNAYREELAARQADAQAKVVKMWEEVEQARTAAAEQRSAADAAFLEAEEDRATTEAQRLRLEQSTAQEQEKMHTEMENFRASLISEFQNRTVETERIADERIKEELTRLEQKEQAADARMRDLDLREEKDSQNQVLIEAKLTQISQSAELAAQEREKWRSEARVKDRLASLAEQRLLDLQQQLIAAQQTPSIADDAAVEAEVHEATRASLDAESASQEAKAQLAQAEERALALAAEQKAIASKAELAEAESARNQEARHFLDLQQTAAREQRQQVESYRAQLETNPDEELPPLTLLAEIPVSFPETTMVEDSLENEDSPKEKPPIEIEASSDDEEISDDETPLDPAEEISAPEISTSPAAVAAASSDDKVSPIDEAPLTPVEENLAELTVAPQMVDAPDDGKPNEESIPEDIFSGDWTAEFDLEATPPAEENSDDVLGEPKPTSAEEALSAVSPVEPWAGAEPASEGEPEVEIESLTSLVPPASSNPLLPEEEQEIKPRYEAPQADLSEPSEEVVVLPAAIVARPTAPDEDESPLFTLSDMLAAPASSLTPSIESPVKPMLEPPITPVAGSAPEIDEEEIAPLDFSLNGPAIGSRPLDPASLGPMTRRELVRPRAIDLGAMNRPPKPDSPEQTPAVLEEEADQLLPILQTIDYSGAHPEQDAATPPKESLLDFELPLLNTPAVRQVNRHNVEHTARNNILGQLFWTLVIVGIALVIAYFFGGTILAFAQNFLHNPGKTLDDLFHSLTHIFGF